MQGSTVPFRPVEIELESTAYSAAPGGSVSVPFALTNHTNSEDYFDISVQGIPAEWVLLDLPVIHLASGERRQASLTIQAPDTSPLSEGVYPVMLRATSQSNRDVWGEAGFDLRVAGYESTMQATPYVSSGRVEVMVNSTQFTVAPGDSLAIPVRITNHGAYTDTFYLTVEGAPGSWASGPAQAATLAPGASSEITLLIQPPVGTRGGRYPFRLRVASQADPSEYTVVDADLAIPSVSQFASDLTPRHMDAGRTARVRIFNLSNLPDTYTLRFQGLNGDLEFVPSVAGPIQVMPGQSAAVDFAVSPRSPNWFGQPVTLPYTVTVRSAGGEAQAHNGDVVSRALIPIWVLPAVLVLCLTAFCGVGFLWNWNQNRLSGARATAQAQAALNAQAATLDAAGTTTAAPAATASAAAAQAATATAAAIAAVPLPPTFTPQPTATKPLPTLAPPSLTPVTPTLAPLPTGTSTPTLAPTIPPFPTNTTLPTGTFTPVPVVLTRTPTPTTAATLALSPAPTGFPLPVTGQQFIVFVSNRGGGQHLYEFNTADSSVKALTTGTGAESDPAWSPDGKQIAFTTNRDGNNEIYVMNADGSNPVNLTKNPADDRYPAWSPDGKHIAFTTNRDGNNEIYVMNADGSNPVNLTKSPANDFKPAWYTVTGLFSSTSRILFTTDRDGNAEIYSMGTDGSNPTNLTKNSANDSLPDIPFTGGKIAFVSNRDGNNEIYTMNTDGGSPTNLTKNPADDTMPVWSPDGKWIAFTSNRDGHQQIYLMAADGSQVTNVTRSPANDSEPAWR